MELTRLPKGLQEMTDVSDMQIMFLGEIDPSRNLDEQMVVFFKESSIGGWRKKYFCRSHRSIYIIAPEGIIILGYVVVGSGRGEKEREDCADVLLRDSIIAQRRRGIRFFAYCASDGNGNRRLLVVMVSPASKCS